MDAFDLDPNPDFPGIPGQLVLLILDGVGLYRGRDEGYGGNAVDQAATPHLDHLLRDAPISIRLKAHGTAVGLPSDSDMGNSEVGHNALGAGRVFVQGAQLVNRAISDGSMFRGRVWRDLVVRVAERGSTFHLIGLLSDGYVHSHIDHLLAMIRQLASEGVKRIRIHTLADGRDVDPISFHRYLDRLENVLAEVRGNGVDAAVASGGGRMNITMDRYEADWDMVRRGWLAHVHARGRNFNNPREALETLRAENPGILDQDLPAFVITDMDGAPVGPILDGDSVVFFNYRGDRAIEISRAFTEPDFTMFDREGVPDVAYAGMMQYDGDLGIPPEFLVSPPAISHTVSEYLVHNGVSQLATAETQKFGHVTYFWNGNNSEKFDPDLEQWVEIPSDDVPFDQRPEMKAREVGEVVIHDLQSSGHRFIRANFANGDMVGHTGSLPAAVKAIDVVDSCVGAILKAAEETGATVIVTADHGNSEMMWDVDPATDDVKLDDRGRPMMKTSHTLSPVPMCVVGPGIEDLAVNPAVETPGLGNIAATVLFLLGFRPPADYLPSLVVPRSRG